MKTVKGFKAFNKDLKCRDMQYEIGKEYTFDGEPIPCQQGFHFCKSIADCYNFYGMSDNTRICEITANGDITTDDEVKYCTNKIKIVREVKNPRVKSNLSNTNTGYCNSGNCNSGSRNSGNYNSGNYNSGNCNSGDWNSGNWNSGNYNSGDWNSGNWNSGNYNSGNYNSGSRNSGYCNSGSRNSGSRNSGNYNSGNWNSGNYNSGSRNSGSRNSGNCNSGNWNSGSRNSGNYNSGDWNSGNYNSGSRNSGSRNSGNCNSGNWNSGSRNSGNYNSGDWNSGNWNSGVFNTAQNPKIKIFDTESEWTMNDWLRSEACTVMAECPCTHSEFICSSAMSAEEKENHPEYKTIDGYIKIIVVTDSDKQAWWDALSSDKRQAVYNLPNFDAKKFKMCTGITVKAESEEKE